MDTNEYHAVYNNTRYHRRRAEQIERLGGKCVDCGAVEHLEFDHVDPGTKQYDIGKIINGRDDILLAELEKCAPRCKPCHKIKSDNVDNAVGHGGGKQGKRRCKCPLCKAAKAAYMKDYMRKRRGSIPR